jgi:hypothetical protein
MADAILEAALRIAEHGRPVFPCHPVCKTPLTAHGFKCASLDPETIRQRWRRWPTALIGMPTGAASDIVVTDLDMKHGKDGIGAFERIRAGRSLPPHPLVGTVSGGRHLYFAAVPGRRVGCSIDRIARGIDVRGDGGYVIVPPSPGYTVLQRAPLHPPPLWLLDLMDPPPPPRPERQRPVVTDDLDEAAERLLRLVGFVASAPEGERNSRLYWAARCAAENGIPERSAAAALEEAATTAGLPKREVERTIASARRASA